MSRLIDTAPERIFLCVSDDLADINRPFPVYPEDEAITWSTNNTVASSVCYVRADLHDEAITVLRDRAGRAEDKLEEVLKTLQVHTRLRDHIRSSR